MSNYYGPLRGRASAGGGGGGGGGSVNLDDGAYQDAVIDPDNASVAFTVGSAGTVVATGDPGYTWLLSGVNSDYDVKVDATSGSFSSGTTGTWLNLATGRTWTRTRTVFGTSEVFATVRIRRVSDGVVLDTANISLTAIVDI